MKTIERMDLPAKIGRYEVVRLLGQGGMGRVVLAHDPVLGRRVAVKVLREDLGLPPEARDALFARMRQEARAAAALEHPHMVTLHDMGEEAPHGLYLVFEYVEGPTLRDKIAEEGGLSLTFIAAMARELGAALTAAHDAGVIHRDVKPENVLLSRYGAKLSDFGIARMPDSTLTSAGAVLGTPAYSAPEALTRAEFGAASDQFSFAATLYESISGARAYPGDDTIAVATRVTTEPPPALLMPSADPRLVMRLDQVLMRGLHRDPAHRFGSCAELGDTLADAIEGRGMLPWPGDAPVPRILETPIPRSIVPRATRRLQNTIAGAALLVILVLLLLGRRDAPRDLHDATAEGVSMHRVATSFASALTTGRPAAALPAPRKRDEKRDDKREESARDAGARDGLSASAPATPDASALDIPALPPASPAASSEPSSVRGTTQDAALAPPMLAPPRRGANE